MSETDSKDPSYIPGSDDKDEENVNLLHQEIYTNKDPSEMQMNNLEPAKIDLDVETQTRKRA